MQATSYCSISNARLPRDVQVAPSCTSPVLSMWLPLLVFGATLWVAQHDMWYARSENPDLAEIDLSGNTARQLAFVMLGAFGALLLLKPSNWPLRVKVVQLACLAALCGMLVLSAFWSDEANLVFKRALIPIAMTVACLGVAKHWQPRQLCVFVLVLTSSFLVLGVLAELATGRFLSVDDYRFVGTMHPNSQAVNCAALGLASLALFLENRDCTSKLFKCGLMFAFLFSVTFLILTKSRTSTAAFVAGAAFLLTLGMPWRRKLAVALVGGFLTAACLLMAFALQADDQQSSMFLDVARMGRNQEAGDVTSLTGRIPIWQHVLSDIAKRPLLGYGYGGFWTEQRVVQYSYIHDWEFAHAHSAYFESMLSIGIVGLMLGLLLVLSTIGGAVRAFSRTASAGFAFAAALLGMALLHGALDGNFVTIGLEAALALLCIAVVALQGGIPSTDSRSEGGLAHA